MLHTKQENTTQKTCLVGERAHLVYKPHIGCPYNRSGQLPYHAMVSDHNIFTCPNHLNLSTFILSEIIATPNLSLKSPFLIRSNLVCPHIHNNILISATSILRVCAFLMDQ
ncbi:hypothetical protein Hanom_Chr09g00794031 [Helianthus anomalus]